MALCFVLIVNEAQIKFEEINPLLLGAMDSVHVPVPGLASHLGCYKCRDMITMILSSLPGHQPVMTNVGRWSVMTS